MFCSTLHWYGIISNTACSFRHYSTKKYLILLEHPNEGCVDSEGSRVEDVCGVAEVSWFVLPRKEETEGRPYRDLQLIRGTGEAGTNLFSLVTSDKTQGIGTKLQKKRFRMDYKVKILH